ncbi:MAG TPA: hypothetical protein VFL31_04345 [Nitrospiraceae bacterium]|nr:hypothetical protein [Nitrospiraceae bacterium]
MTMNQRAQVIALLPVVIFVAVTLIAERTTAQVLPSELEGLRAFKILVEPLDKEAESEQIDARTLENQVLVTIRSKAPGLRYDPGVIPYLYVNVNIMTSETSYSGNISLELKRPVEVLIGVHRHGQTPSKRVWTVATVWDSSYTFRGGRGGGAAHVRTIMDLLLERFLADYFRGNP